MAFKHPSAGNVYLMSGNNHKTGLLLQGQFFIGCLDEHTTHKDVVITVLLRAAEWIRASKFGINIHGSNLNCDKNFTEEIIMTINKMLDAEPI